MKNKIVELIAANVEGLTAAEIADLIEIPPKPELGDFAFPCFRLAKTMRKAPQMIANDIKEAIGDVDFLQEIQVQGAYLNFFVKKELFIETMVTASMADDFGSSTEGNGQTICIDYSSPNVAKNFHVGHLRTTIIGNSLYKIYSKLGYKVVRINHLGDWGTQFGILIKGYRELLTEDEREHLSVANLEKCYVLSAAKAKEADGVWKEACKAELVKLQRGDPANRALWKKFIDISIAEFNRMYDKLGVKFDTYRGESYYNDTMPGVVARLQEMGLAVESEGALVVNLEAEKLGVAIVRKSDGGYNYTTSDLACVELRVKEYDPERIIYVTDARQQLHFRQWFSIAGKMGYTVKLVHVPFGLMSYQGKAISTREGNLIKLDDLLAEAVRRAHEIVKDRGGDEKLAEQIGFGAVKYSDLSHDPITDIDFSWDKALALEGNSGPYLQYAYARVCSLMEKAGNPDIAGFSFNVSTQSEKLLALQLLKFGDTVRKAAENYKPSLLADYLFQTAQIYSSFYQQNPILKSEPDVRDARLKLCALFGKVLAKGLDLLGIAAPNRI